MLGAHFDSWHTGTGATDNAAGSAVMLEAMRILKASGLKMRRTVRLALWTGEEQGLLGSKAYVKANFADKETMALKPAHAKISGYFNVDNGTGAIRGVYLQGNDAIGQMFTDWMKPFASLGMTMMTPQNTSGTDHLSFDAVGIPAFQFVQDEVEYETADASLEHGRLGSAAGQRHDEERRDRRVLRLRRGKPRADAAEKAAAQAAARTADDAAGGEADAELELVKGLGVRR